MVDFSEDNLSDRIRECQHYYNSDLVHGSIGKSSMERVVELGEKTPFWDEMEDLYYSSREFIRMHDYAEDVKLLKPQRSL